MTDPTERITAAEVFNIPDEFSPPLHKVLGVKLGLGADGQALAWIEVDPAIHYGNRWAHGGIVATLADIASGVAIARKVGDPYHMIDGTIELKVNYIRKVVEGDLTAAATLLHLGKRIAVTEVVCTNRGVLCARGLATFMLREAPARTDIPDLLPRT